MGQSTSQRVCNNCGTLNSVADEYCANCGFSLDSPPMATVVSAINTPTQASFPGRRVTGALVSGELLGTRYRIMQLVGRGGFGAVYQANDERFQGRRRVAIKEMSDAHLNANERTQAITNFRREADILVQLKHANLPDVSDFLEESGKAYLIMEFVDGQTVEEVQKDAGGPLDEALVMGWALQLCDVLDYLHNQPQPIIFRDLKPPNIMLTRANQIKLIDFGIARVFKTTSAKDTETLGSQGYAPLEQYGRGQSDARTDIYALGATLYDLLTNTLPPASPMRRINSQSFVSPRVLNPRLLVGTEQILLKAMEEFPQDRYQSAAEMFQAITNLGFAITRNVGGIRTPTGPNTLTVAATQPGSHIPASTLSPQPTQMGPAPTVSASTQQGALTVASQQGGPASLSATQPVGRTYPYSNVSAGPVTPSPAPPFQGQSQAPVFPAPARPQPRLPRSALLIGGVAVVAAGVGIYYVSHGSSSGAPGAGNAITVNFAYSSEKDAWLQAALKDFRQSSPALNGKTINVVLNDLGSVDSQNQILKRRLNPMPVAWSPASTLEVNRLNYQWQQANGGASIISDSGQFQSSSLVKSPLVLAAWKERADKLLTHYKVSTLDWQTLASAFQVNNWSQLGGNAGWGPVKFGQTLPDQSNSGLLTITLLAYNHYNEERGLTLAQIRDAGCWSYLSTFEGAVNAFGHSSGTYLLNVIDQSGPAQADIIATYENLVLADQTRAQSAQHQALQIYYPAVNILSDHPFAVLQGDWATDEQRQAALQFRNFLLDIPQQRQALTFGFRPAIPAVSVDDSSVANNPFVSLTSIFPNRQPNALLSLAQAPDGQVVDALISGWTQHYPTPPTLNG